MRLALAVLSLLLLAPAAQACSLAYMPFADATFHDDGLWYVDGSSLKHVDGTLETTVAEGFFVSYARLDGDRLLVAGQDGLGADCSGDRWLELRDGAAVVWEDDIEARVFPHGQGPFVQAGGPRDQLYRLDGDALVHTGDLPDDAWILGFTTEGDPVIRGTSLQFGDRSLALSDPYGEPAVAAHDGLLAVLESSSEPPMARLHVVDGDEVRTVSWTPEGGWGAGLVWAGGWLALAGERAYLVGDQVTDLGVAGARAVAARGDQGVVFTEEGYVVFDGTQPVEAWQRTEPAGLWRPTAPDTKPAHAVASEGGSGATLTRSPGEIGAEGHTDGQTDDGTLDIGAPTWIAILLAVALATAARRRS